MIFHTEQAETSHSPDAIGQGKYLTMDESEVFRGNLLRLMAEKGLKAAELSRNAGLNPRMVKDIEEGRVRSPKLSTVFKLARALNCDPGEMMGLGKRPKVRADLAEYLSQYSEADQERLLSAIQVLPSPPDANR